MTRRAALVLVTSLTLAACSRPALSGEAGDGEHERAAAAAAVIEKDWPLAGAGPVPATIRRVGRVLVRAAGTVPFRWRFTVVRDRSANAFAIGDGRIYVNEGALLLSQNEAELAAILAHEMGHQLAGHFRREPRSKSKGFLSDLATIFGGGNVAAERSNGVHREFDLTKELEADRISLPILAGANYDPRAALTIATRLHDQSGSSRHLGDEQRIRALSSLLDGVPAGGRLDSEEFRRVKRELD